MKESEIPGPVITREDEPELMAFIDDAVADCDAPPIGVVCAIAAVEAQAFVRERLMGDTERMLVLGTGLFPLMTRGQFRGVLAHEMSHFVSGDSATLGWLGGIRELVNDVLDGEMGRFWARALARPGHAILRASGRYSREREMIADGFAVEVYGLERHKNALIRAIVGGQMYVQFVQNELEPLLTAEARPTRIMDGFARYLQVSAAKAEELSQALYEQETEEGASYPALVERLVSAASRAPDEPKVGPRPDDDEPALTLLRDFAGLDAKSCARWMEELGATAFRAVDWYQGHRLVVDSLSARTAQAIEPARASLAPDAASTAEVTDAFFRALSSSDQERVAGRLLPEVFGNGVPDGYERAVQQSLLVTLVALLTQEAIEAGAPLTKAFGVELGLADVGGRHSLVEEATALLDSAEPLDDLDAFRARLRASPS